ncbi:MAG: hypothetical protein UU93_C0014G0004 [Candidatus Amesbacteria bacterium GW2011_GWA2_42_12]|uniref:HTH cro/C1-type domain-containing protein n=1 Tax=Candidatus Amesbacteria bacterium GW2011_GWA2_42_12 TaxID=1618356 RepID=A0A0G0Y4X4_9BACT|nr:MAG: hypothetical protein UU93_C0014G0004 [Candidatus Amesbacteria bacterium GW2011_GWA2_42_12]
MKTAGSLLKEARESSSYSLEELSKRTKIREEYLRAIENDSYDGLPSGPFVRGFLRSFANEVGVNPETIVATYRRDFGTVENTGLFPKGLLNPIRRKTHMMINPVLFGILVVCAVVLGFVVYQWQLFVQPPQLTIYEPIENQELRSPVLVRGVTASDAVVTVNQTQVATDQDGKFTTQVELNLGDQTVSVETSNRQGKTRVVLRHVNVIK